MTTQQLFLFNALYLIALLVVAFFTRATLRRIAGALAGAALVSAVALGADALGEKDTAHGTTSRIYKHAWQCTWRACRLRIPHTHGRGCEKVRHYQRSVRHKG